MLLLLLALTVFSPLALYTSRLPAALNPIRKRPLPRCVIWSRFESYLGVFLLGLGLLTISLPRFCLQKRGIFLEKSRIR